MEEGNRIFLFVKYNERKNRWTILGKRVAIKPNRESESKSDGIRSKRLNQSQNSSVAEERNRFVDPSHTVAPLDFCSVSFRFVCLFVF